MTGLQIAMIVIGMVCLIGSFFVSEKLSKADLEEMKKMSEQEIKVILDARMQDASAQIDEKIQDKVEDAVAQIERGGEPRPEERHEHIAASQQGHQRVFGYGAYIHEQVA